MLLMKLTKCCTVLSIIFVVEPIISDKGYLKPAYIPLSIDIPEYYKGEVVDPCTIEFSAPGCAYDLALTSLTSQLVTYSPYTLGGVTFEPPNGTMGLPYWAFEHFRQQASKSPFEEQKRRYCLPVLDPQLWSCKEEPFNQEQERTYSNLVQYKLLRAFETIHNHTDHSLTLGARVNDLAAYKIIIDYPSEE